MRARLRRLLGISDSQQAATQAQLRFALNEISELRQLVRTLLHESPGYMATMAQTTQSFDVQWDKIPTGIQLKGNPKFDREALDLVERYSGLSKAWFQGKSALDAGCGNGRWSYALASLGAAVTAIDQSEAGLSEVRQICGHFPKFRAVQHDILKPLPDDWSFEFVWNFGVAHHTGNTERALRHVCNAVRPGGMLFTMIYGEPRENSPGDYMEVNSYTVLRRATFGMDFAQRISFLRERFKEEDINAWFDAISPKINDLHRFDEVYHWLVAWGFTDVRRTFENRNLFIAARRRT